MAGYLENFGQAEVRRERVLRRLAIAAGLLILAAIIGYFLFRDYREKQVVEHFLNLLREKKYEEAYRFWGCTPEHPCSGYKYDMFLEDFGPKGPHGDMSKAKIARRQHCTDGYLMVIEWGPDDRLPLYVNREDRSLSIFPHPICDFRFKSPLASKP